MSDHPIYDRIADEYAARAATEHTHDDAAVIDDTAPEPDRRFFFAVAAIVAIFAVAALALSAFTW